MIYIFSLCKYIYKLLIIVFPLLEKTNMVWTEWICEAEFIHKRQKPAEMNSTQSSPHIPKVTMWSDSCVLIYVCTPSLVNSGHELCLPLFQM